MRIRDMVMKAHFIFFQTLVKVVILTIVLSISTFDALALPSNRLRGHELSVMCISFSSDGKRLASGSIDGTVIIWDLQTGKSLQALRHEKAVYAVAFSPDGNILGHIHEFMNLIHILANVAGTYGV